MCTLQAVRALNTTFVQPGPDNAPSPLLVTRWRGLDVTLRATADSKMYSMRWEDHLLACSVTAAIVLTGGNSAVAAPAPGQRLGHAVGIHVGTGGDVELAPSCAQMDAAQVCSRLLFLRVDAGVSWRMLPGWELALWGTYGRSGESDVATHTMYKAAISFRYFTRFGLFEPSIAAFAGVAGANDAPVDGLAKPVHQMAPMIGAEIPIGLAPWRFRVALVPGIFVAPFPAQPLGTTIARDHLLWWAAVGLRVAYDTPLQD